MEMSETWLRQWSTGGLEDIVGYTLARLDRSWSENEGQGLLKRGRGLLCYVKNCFHVSDTKYASNNYSCIL